MFRPIYYRNNRNSGQKNIRCFPTCSDQHLENHFCGRPVEVVLTMSYPVLSASSSLPNFKLSDVRLVAEFALLPSTDMINTEVSSPPGQTNPPNKYYLGRAVSNCSPEVSERGRISSSCTFQFNSECKGWHYSWVGSRFSTVLSHAYFVSLYIPKNSHSSSLIFPPLQQQYRLASFLPEDFQDPYNSNKLLQKVCLFTSPTFHIASLRRKRNAQNAVREPVGHIPLSSAFEFNLANYEATTGGVRMGALQPASASYGRESRPRSWHEGTYEDNVKFPRLFNAVHISAPPSPTSPQGAVCFLASCVGALYTIIIGESEGSRSPPTPTRRATNILGGNPSSSLAMSKSSPPSSTSSFPFMSSALSPSFFPASLDADAPNPCT